MNARMEGIANEFENNRLGPDEPFKFHCTMCGKCCINQEDILLNPRDMYNLAKELEMTPDEVMNTYCETYIGSDSRMPLVRLKPRGAIKRCPLLKDRKCSVHKAKPTACRLYPFAVEPALDGSYKYLLSMEQAHHFKGGQVQAGRWMKKFFTPEDGEFMRIDKNML